MLPIPCLEEWWGVGGFARHGPDLNADQALLRPYE